MIEIIAMNENTQKIQLLQLNVCSAELDIRKAIRDASREYCKSKTGKLITNSDKDFTYEDFVEYVPNSICRKYGFQKLQSLETDIVVDYHGTVVSKSEIVDLRVDDNRENSINETALYLARMWGVRETLNRLPNIENDEVLDIVTRWAMEFVDSGAEDLPKFFAEKAKSIDEDL